MNASAQLNSGSLISYVIKSAGKAIPESYEVYSISVDKAINRIGSATIVLLDGSAAEEDFEVSSSNTFVPGAEISIEVGYNNTNNQIFQGIVVRQTLRVDDDVGSALEVVCKHQAIKMTVGRKSASFKKSTDSSVISKLIGNSGLSASVTSTSAKIPELVQYYCSDWDFMLSRTEVNGMIVSTSNGKVSVFKYDKNTNPVLEIKYGLDLLGLRADLNSVTQLSAVKASAWDYKKQKLLSVEKSNSVAGVGNLSGKKLAQVIGLPDYQLQTTAAIDNENLTAWAEGQLRKSEYSKIIGEVSCQGSSKLEPGTYISLAGLGARFNGNHIVSSVMHNIQDGNWVSEVGFGMSANWFVQEPDVMAPPASGLLPGVQGLYNGTVKKNYGDPDSEYRVLVDLPLFDSSGEGLWARLTNFYSTAGQGAFFIPEVGDEVIVGFLNDDPRFPIILGSVYSTKKKPNSELKLDEKNSKKAIVTKSELQIVFDDENKKLTVSTPANNMAVFDDDKKQISLKDQHGNSIVMSESGIDISSPKKITLKAKDKVVVSGTKGVSVEASAGNVSVSGMNISENAKQQYSAKGTMASVKGSASLTLKAGMVMIN